MATLPPDHIRLQVDLEFVHLLANLEYVQSLLDAQYFEDEKFRTYLRYLQYIRRPEYSCYVKYPRALYMLEKLTDPTFYSALLAPVVECHGLSRLAVYMQQDALDSQFFEEDQAEMEAITAQLATRRTNVDSN